MTNAASWFHLSVKPVSRSAGRSVVAAAAYRLGARIADDRAQIVHDYRARSGVESSFTVAPANSPQWAFVPEQLWNAAELAERRVNSTLAREVELALPASVDANTRRAITEAFAAELVDRYGVAVSTAIHHPSHGGDQRNHHAHILFTTREMTPEGLGAKTRILDDRVTGPQEVHYLREMACDLINDALAGSGSDERVDHRSFKTRGIDQEPTTHLGPTATEIERRGAESDIGNENRAVRERNEERSAMDELVADLAALDEEIRQELLAEREGDYLYDDGQEEPEPVETFEWKTREEEAKTPIPEPDTDEVQSNWKLRQPEPRQEAPQPNWKIRDPEAQLPAPETEERNIDAEAEQAQAHEPVDDFTAVHDATMEAARDEQSAMEIEDAPERFARVRGWWQNLQGHFTEWRTHLQDRFAAYWQRDPAPAEPSPPTGEGPPPAPPPEPNQGM
jgi:hypothetical protein